MISDTSPNSSNFGATNLEWVYECYSGFSEYENWLWDISGLNDWGIEYIEKHKHYKHKYYNLHKPIYLNSNNLHFKKTKPHTRGRIMQRIKK